MDPEPTVREIARILRPAGVLCPYEYRSITNPTWDAEVAHRELRERAARIRLERGIDRGLPQWPVSLELIAAGGWFDDVRETFLHSVEFGDGARLVAPHAPLTSVRAGRRQLASSSSERIRAPISSRTRRKTARRSSSVPVAADGSSNDQCSCVVAPGKNGHASRDSSQTVTA